jgi:signal transduction histidine kinase
MRRGPTRAKAITNPPSPPKLPKNMQLTVDERLGQMRADERKVRQVVLNLLSNAIKFTPEGGRSAGSTFTFTIPVGRGE